MASWSVTSNCQDGRKRSLSRLLNTMQLMACQTRKNKTEKWRIVNVAEKRRIRRVVSNVFANFPGFFDHAARGLPSLKLVPFVRHTGALSVRSVAGQNQTLA